VCTFFFGAYYGGARPCLRRISPVSQALDRAAALSQNQLQLVEVYRARYLLRQMGAREAFHTALSRVLDAPASPDPN